MLNTQQLCHECGVEDEPYLLITVWMGSARTSHEESRSAASRSSLSWSLPIPAVQSCIIFDACLYVHCYIVVHIARMRSEANKPTT